MTKEQAAIFYVNIYKHFGFGQEDIGSLEISSLEELANIVSKYQEEFTAEIYFNVFDNCIRIKLYPKYTIGNSN